MKRQTPDPNQVTRRTFVEAAAVASMAAGTSLYEAPEADAAESHPCTITINGMRHQLEIPPPVTLLDLLRERLHLTGTKKGCDHGQCGACTVIVDGQRINSCLALAISLDGSQVTTIEGLGAPGRLHEMQTAFLEHDGFQCGFCTSGQICSAVAMLEESRKGLPSAVSATVAEGRVSLTEDEIRERMAGNICRCGAYPNIVAAILDVNRRRSDA